MGDRIREMRLERGLSQKKFAELVGVHSSDISRVEAGKGMLGPQLIKRVAKTLRGGIDWLQ